MLVEQNNVCKICSNEFKSTKDTHIDHCHNSDTVRGLLCNSCNMALGQFNDNTDNMDNAIRYLQNSWHTKICNVIIPIGGSGGQQIQQIQHINIYNIYKRYYIKQLTRIL